MTVTVVISRDQSGNDTATDVYEAAEYFVSSNSSLLVKKDQQHNSPTIAQYAEGKWIAAYVGDAPKQTRPQTGGFA